MGHGVHPRRCGGAISARGVNGDSPTPPEGETRHRHPHGSPMHSSWFDETTILANVGLKIGMLSYESTSNTPILRSIMCMKNPQSDAELGVRL